MATAVHEIALHGAAPHHKMWEAIANANHQVHSHLRTEDVPLTLALFQPTQATGRKHDHNHRRTIDFEEDLSALDNPPAAMCCTNRQPRRSRL